MGQLSLKKVPSRLLFQSGSMAWSGLQGPGYPRDCLQPCSAPGAHTVAHLWRPTCGGPRDYWLSDREGQPSTPRDGPTSQG